MGIDYKAGFQNLYDLMTQLEKYSSEADQAARDITAEGHLETIRFFAALSKFHDRLVEVKRFYDTFYDRMSKDVIPEMLREAGVKNVKLEDVGTVGVSYRFSCSIIGEDKTPGYDWLRENGLGDLIKETVNSGTLAATAKDLIENEGRELPPDIFKTGTSPYTSITNKPK